MNTTLNHMRFLPLMAILALAVPVCAQSISFTNGCTNRSNSDARNLMRDAYDFVYEHRHLVFDEIDRDRAGANLYRYEQIPQNDRDQWLDKIREVKINCDTSGCDNNPLRAGRENFLSDNKIVICYANIQSYAHSHANSAFAIIAGTIAHEVMHKCDGLATHPSNESDSNPKTMAQTMSSAMEHLAMTPDLSPSILSHELLSDGRLKVRVEVRNCNEWFGGPNTLPLSGFDRNVPARVALYADDDLVDILSLNQFAAGGTQTVSLYWSNPVAGSVELMALADYDDDLWEYDEENNTDTHWAHVGCDLEIASVEIAGPYSDHPLAFPVAYRELTYRVKVVNNSSTSPAVSVSQSVLTSAAHTANLGNHQQQSVPSLGASGERTYTFTVRVPISRLRGGLNGTSIVTWQVDEDGDAVDSDRGNNTASLLIDQDYFRPDYTVQIKEVVSESGQNLVSLRVKNLGPEPGEVRTDVQLEVNGGLSASHSVRKLDPAEGQNFQFQYCVLIASGSVNYSVTLKLTVDPDDSIDENNEDNNTASYTRVWLGELNEVVHQGILELQPLERHQQLPIDPSYFRFLEPHLIDPIDYIGSNGPFLPETDMWFLRGERDYVIFASQVGHLATENRAYGPVEVALFEQHILAGTSGYLYQVNF